MPMDRNHRRVPTYGYDSQVHDINGGGFAAISPPDGVQIRVRGQIGVFGHGESIFEVS